jgi:hypothetical protein
MVKPVRYLLEIYVPGNVDSLLANFEAESPFMAISKGDFLNPRSWYGADKYKLLRAVNVEHILLEGETRTTHKVCVFTESLEDSPSMLLGQHE